MGETVEFTGLPGYMVDGYWDDIKPLIDKALKKQEVSEYTLDDIKGFLKERDMQAWVALDEKIIGCVITQIINFPRKKVLDVLFIGGERFDTWAYGWNILNEFAKDQGCKKIKGDGRDGWVKKIPGAKVTKLYTWDIL
jgi:hypothetical protein